MSDPTDEVLDLIFARWRSQTLYHGVELGVFELLAEGSRTAREVAGELDLDPANSYRLLRALGSLDLLDERPDGTFSLTDRGEVLTSDHPTSLRGIARLVEGHEQYSVWPRLSDLVESGEADAFEDEFGRPLFEYVQADPEHAETFARGMKSHSTVETRDVIAALEDRDLSGVSRLCDVGGGTGHLLAHLLRERPHLEGEVLELPDVVERAGAVPEELGVEDRIAFTAGDMFEAVPEADGYVMKHILHDWNDDDCVEILGNIGEAAPDGAPVFVAEYVIPGPDDSHFSNLFDLHMLLMVGGRERTVEEYGELFNRAGMELARHHRAEGQPMSVVEGRA